ncbi:cell wall-binding repeat-containing protein [Mesobacillus subterraneus]|uniref:cell wall-binding repeat-containing protein n=1 Tax=Mesobacillus subterraneus TaxID=285983 RepID=UPI00273D0040|nr:cell wall-binding repeat-containing protein [Mesobacillus subterraneus]WLR55452.1 cell wall-binding repeat-containing protein [Mesobacillus subterraneus]
MKGFTKFVSVVATISLIVSPFTNSVFAEEDITNKEDLRKELIVNQLEQRSSELIYYQNQFTSTQAVATEAVYKQQINYNRIHEYHFTTGGGIFTVESMHVDNYDVDYFIYEMNSEEIMEPVDENYTYDLPEGTYYLVVMGYSDEQAPYEYKLSGPFSTQPDTVLPNLNITKPASEEIRLAKNSSPSISVAGNSDAIRLSVTLNEEQEVDLNAPGAFTYDHLVLGQGFNTIMFNAMKLGGNSVTALYSITLPGVSRIIGWDRYQVSSNISRTLRYWGFGSSTVIITRGDLYPDAVSGGPLAYAEDAPVLLTKPNSLPPSVITELENIQPERAIILGGTGSVSTAVESQLEDMGIEVDRIAGKDRYVVSASIAQRVVDYWESDTALIASGEAFPDALSASTLAGPAGMPILLVRPKSLPAAMETFIKNNPQIKNFIVVGGPAAVSDSVATRIKQLRPGASFERIGGQNRYEVSVNVAKYSMENYGMDASSLTFARGDLFPDALSGAPLANYFYSPVILTPANGLHEQVSRFLTQHKAEIDHMYIFGGTGAVSPTVEQQLGGFIR